MRPSRGLPGYWLGEGQLKLVGAFVGEAVLEPERHPHLGSVPSWIRRHVVTETGERLMGLGRG